MVLRISTPVTYRGNLGVAWGFPGGSDGKESACNGGDLGSIAGLGRWVSVSAAGHPAPPGIPLADPRCRQPLVVVRAWVGKEFPDVRQNERRIKFIRAGDAVRTMGQLKGEPATHRGLYSAFIPGVQGVG